MTTPATQYRLEHFKCEYDPTWDYTAVATDIFNGPRVLVIAEKMHINAHVHFQGETTLAPTTFGDKITALAAKHWRKKECPNSRPVKRAKKEVNETGFQYVLKEEPAKILYSRGFTDKELEELHEKALEHKDMYKKGLYEHLLAILVRPTDEGKEVYYRFFDEAHKWLKDNDRQIFRHTRMDILNAMASHPNTTVSMRRYVADHI